MWKIAYQPEGHKDLYLVKNGSLAVIEMRNVIDAMSAGTHRDQPRAPPDLRQALAVLNRHVDNYIDRVRLGKAAKNLTQTSRS